jgi:hypothetical protein
VLFENVPIQYADSCLSVSRHARSSEHFSHWLTVDVLYVAPLADTMFFFVSHHAWICPRPGFVLVFLLLVKKRRQHADVPTISISKLPALVYACITIFNFACFFLRIPLRF